MREKSNSNTFKLRNKDSRKGSCVKFDLKMRRIGLYEAVQDLHQNMA